MRKIGIIAVLSLILVAVTAAVAWADSPHFTRATAAVDGSGNLVVTFKEAGLGTTVTTEHITVTADASAVYQCFNNGGNHPKAGNKETVTAPVSGGGDFPVRNGSASGSVTVAPPGPGSFSCPSGQHLVFISVTYSNITITGSGGETATVPSTISFP
ncbi:MAG TPA: hypothetical protein VFI90_19095 [Rubrobacter sp.]|nr:hypothetical protein [Rubrobacter sp.]